jgi:hypothetical protein
MNYTGTITKIGKTDSELQNFGKGYKFTGEFSEMPMPGEPFALYTFREYFRTSMVLKARRLVPRNGYHVIKIQTRNSIYRLTYK